MLPALLLLLPLQAESPGWRFLADKYDANGDGRVVPAEYARGPDSFARMDRDGDGALTPADFAEEWSVRWREAYMQAPQVQELLMRAFEKDGAPGLARAELLQRLAASDGDADARLSAEEFAALAPAAASPADWPALAAWLGAAAGAPLAHAALAEAFDALDINRDGLLVPPDHPDRDLPLRPDGKPLALIFGSFT